LFIVSNNYLTDLIQSIFKLALCKVVLKV